MLRRPHAPGSEAGGSSGAGGGRPGKRHHPDSYLAQLIVLPGQLVPGILCRYGELILGLLIISSVEPLLRMSEGG